MKRRNQILIAILVVQVALGFVVFWPRQAETSAGESLFPELAVGEVKTLTIVDAEGNSIQLNRVAEEWVLPGADDYPAQAEKIPPVLEKIVELSRSRLVTRTDASHKRLQVAETDFVRRIEFELAGGIRYTLYLGSSPQYGATHFRVEGESEVYLTSALSAWEIGATAASWIDPLFMSISQDDIAKVTLENANGQLVFTKDAVDGDATGTWTMDGLTEGEELDIGLINSLINQAASVRITTPLGRGEDDAYRMDEPSAIVTLETGDGAITVRVGAKDPAANTYFVKVSTNPTYVAVSEFNVNYLVESTREELLLAPPTPASEGDASLQ